MLQVFARHGLAPLRAEWESMHALAGRSVAVALGDRTHQTGIAAGVADDGALLLQTESGLRRCYSGEVSVRPVEPALRSA